MHSIVCGEAAQRRLDKAHGSPAKDRSSLRLNHPTIRPTAASLPKLSKLELQELAKPSFARMGKSANGRLSKKHLDQLMIMQHNEEQLKSIKRQEEEWIKRGGILSRNAGDNNTSTSVSKRFEAYAEHGLIAVGTGDAVEDEASADENDEDDTLDPQGPESPELVQEDDMPSDNMAVSEDSRSPGDEEEEVVALKRNKHGQRRPRVVVESDDEGVQLVQRNPPDVQMDTASSMESQTEDENDANSAKLMYDPSEDKENKAIAHHGRSSSELSFDSRLGSLHVVDDGTQSSLSLAPDTDFNITPGSPKGDARSPLKDISKDDDVLSSPSQPPFRDRLLQSAVISPLHTSASALTLASSPVLRSENASRIAFLSIGSDNDENSTSGLKASQPSFLERLQSQISLEPSLAYLNPLPNGGFSQLFSAEDQCSKRSVNDGIENDGISLTLDVRLKPALEVSNTLRQKAETIFEREQECVVAAAVRQNDRPKELLYLNDHGFLTQTCPEDSSPQIYRMTPFQASPFIETQAQCTQTQSFSARPPLRTLSFTASQELSPEPRPLRRLRKRSPSPLEQKVLGQSNNLVTKLNPFNVLGKDHKLLSEAQDKHKKSEFVAVEAEESDEDDTFGFGGPKKDADEEEDDDDDEDKPLEDLMDDTFMDVETEAANLVQEKHREHEEEDDQRLQKLHEDAIQGKFRMKRRDGISIEDESDEDDNEDERRIRQRMHKKRKIDGDNLEALGQNEETRAFYNTYHQDLIDEDDDFGYLRGNTLLPTDDGDATAGEPVGQETVSVNEIRQRVREMVQDNCEVEVMDPEDTDWVDQSMVTEADDTVHVKVVECQRSKPAARRLNAGQMDFDIERPKRFAESDQHRSQLKSWAKNQNHRHRGTGRSGHTAAVTGHAKTKSGNGSLRSTPLSNLATASAPCKTTKTSSLLSMVSNRSGKFA